MEGIGSRNQSQKRKRGKSGGIRNTMYHIYWTYDNMQSNILFGRLSNFFVHPDILLIIPGPRQCMIIIVSWSCMRNDEHKKFLFERFPYDSSVTILKFTTIHIIDSIIIEREPCFARCVASFPPTPYWHQASSPERCSQRKSDVLGQSRDEKSSHRCCDCPFH